MVNNDNQIDNQDIVDKTQFDTQQNQNFHQPNTQTQSDQIEYIFIKQPKPSRKYFLFGVIAGIISLAIIPILLLLSVRIVPSRSENINESANESVDLGFSAHIYEPDENAHILQGDSILFNGGVVKTTSNDEFWQYNMTWNSNIQGFLGRGEDLTYKYLSPGEHEITFSVESNSGSKSSAEIIMVVKADPSINERQLSQYLSDCKVDGKYEECLYEIIPKLAVWNRNAALDLIKETSNDSTLYSVYEGVLYDLAQATYDSDLCGELTDKEFLEGCYVSMATDTRNPELCELAGSRVGNCYHWVASAMRDESYCSKADNPSTCAENVKGNIAKDPYFNL